MLTTAAMLFATHGKGKHAAAFQLLGVAG